MCGRGKSPSLNWCSIFTETSGTVHVCMCVALFVVCVLVYYVCVVNVCRT